MKISQRLARWVMSSAGWTLTGELPPFGKAVFIAVPHTSNWDGIWFILYKFAIDVKVSFLAKHKLFWWPLGRFLSAIGAIPVDRNAAGGIVPQLIDEFERKERLYLALAPEGTRAWQPYWKSGFYRIAKAAGVPIVLAYIDYRKRALGIGPTLPDNQTLDQDLETMRNFYAAVEGKRPDNQGPIEFAPDDVEEIRRVMQGNAS